jgi:limonene-1,2-epoxide hydrolase
MNNMKAAAPQPVPVMETFAKELSGANQRAANVVRRLTEMNVKMWGNTPVGTGMGKDEVQPCGMVTVLQCELNSLHALLDSADAAIDRLEQLV